MAATKRISDKKLQKRWLRDRRAESAYCVYVPEEVARPARRLEGFELREDGTYVEIDSGETDRPEESPGTWTLDAEGLLTLRQEAGGERKIRIVECTDERLEVEE